MLKLLLAFSHTENLRVDFFFLNQQKIPSNLFIYYNLCCWEESCFCQMLLKY